MESFGENKTAPGSVFFLAKSEFSVENGAKKS